MVPWLLWWMQPWAVAVKGLHSDVKAWRRTKRSEQRLKKASAWKQWVTRSTGESSGCGSKVDSLTLRFQTTKLFFFDSVPNFHLRHWHRLNSSWCVCVKSVLIRPYRFSMSSPNSVWECACCPHLCWFSCASTCTRAFSQSALRSSKIRPGSVTASKCDAANVSWDEFSFFFLPFIWFHCAAVKEVNKSCLQRQNSQREKEKDNLISSRLTRLSCHRLSGKDLRIENRKESDASELFSLSLTVSHFHDGL